MRHKYGLILVIREGFEADRVLSDRIYSESTLE